MLRVVIHRLAQYLAASVNVALGLWVAVSPWLLGFAGVANAMWAHLLIGLAVAALAAYEAWRLSDETRPTTV